MVNNNTTKTVFIDRNMENMRLMVEVKKKIENEAAGGKRP